MLLAVLFQALIVALVVGAVTGQIIWLAWLTERYRAWKEQKEEEDIAYVNERTITTASRTDGTDAGEAGP